MVQRGDSDVVAGFGILNAAGQQQMETITKRLKPLLPSDRVLILSSESSLMGAIARSLQKVLGGRVDFEEYLHLSHQGYEAALLSGLRNRQKEADVIVLVADTLHTSRFPPYFCQAVWGVSLERIVLGAGEALVIDLATRQVTHVSHSSSVLIS